MLFSRIQNLTFLSSILLLSACGGGSSGGGETNNNEIAPQEKTTYLVSTLVNEGGRIEPISFTVESGSSATFTVMADENYMITSVSGCDGNLTGNTYLTNAVTGTCEVSAMFSLIPPADDEAPIVNVLFPANNSRANGSQITVRGTASDEGGVKAVRVNGKLANITTQQESNSIGLLDEVVNTQVDWQIEVQSDIDEDLVITTEDDAGNIDETAESIKVFNAIIPSNFIVDKTNNRLIGHLNPTQFAIVDLPTKFMHVINVQSLGESNPFTYYENQNSLIHSELIEEQLTLSRIDVASGDVEVILNHDLQLDSSKWSFAHVKSLVIGPEEDELFMLLTYFPVEGVNQAQSIIMKLDLNTNSLSTIIEGQTLSGNSVSTSDIAYTSKGLIVFNSAFGGNDDGLSIVEFDGSDSKAITGNLGITSASVDVDHQNNTAYVAGYKGFSRIDLTTGEHSEFSLETDQDELAISQIRSTGLDLSNDQYLVRDSDLDVIVAVNLTSGTRTTFASNGVGTGRVMIAPRELSLDSANNIAYIADDGGNSPGFILAIDMETGDRETVYSFEDEYNYMMSGLSFDPATNILYTSINNQVLAINIEDKSSEVISSASIGSGVFFSGITDAVLDKTNERVLVVDYHGQAILAVNLSDGSRTIISSSNSDSLVGEGISIYGISSIALDEANQLVYAASQVNKNIISIDLATGNRSLLLNSCEGEDFVDDGLNHISFNKYDNSLLFANRVISQFNIDDNVCKNSSLSLPFDLEQNERGQTFANDFNKLYQIDLVTNEKVILSK
ncbi:hypothetical protein J8L86_12915 [Shewanella sp. MMG014]|uniref:Ig-like domain-containing protein n=1 Tax=Shewanella sp. MMG014 TaxID=2822691 RepID=UPI001B37057B|nr:Ig-like domain-containing protein [Shewanella sp. MMG014]MBQ4890755.1 hypothetical protein [Shewanella sp. MMG014]